MLEIRQVDRYTITRYPKGAYFQPSPSLPGILLKKGAISLVLLTLIEACEKAGGSGPPPVEPDMITENEARQAIEAARAAGAEQHARPQLDEANSLLDTAQQMLNDRRFRDAKRSASQARDAAIRARETAAEVPEP